MTKLSQFLDLKSIPCPLNVVKCKLALEKLSSYQTLVLDLDKGEPEIMVEKALKEMGVTLHDWSKEDRAKFRQAALGAWEEWRKKSPEADALIDIHTAYMKANGIL